MRALLPITVLGFSCLVSSVSAQSPTSTSPVVADILKLSNAKVDEGVILTYIQSAPRGNVSAADLVELHSNGISSRVLVALLNSRPPEAAQMAASTEVRQPVSDPAPAQPAPENVGEPAQAGASSNSSSAVVEAPLVDYVSTPVYVGVGSVYYHDYAWWGIGWGLGWGYLGWSGWYPWYGYAWYPHCGYSGFYAHSRYYHGHDGHHGHGGHDAKGHPQNGGGPYSIARLGGNPNSGLAASPVSRPVSGAATARPQVAANRAGTSTATANLSSRNIGTSRVAASPGGNPVFRSSTYAANAQTSTAGVGQNGGARPAIKRSSGADRPVAFPGTGQQPSTIAGRSFTPPTRSAPSSFSPAGTVTPRYAGIPTTRYGYQGGGPRASGSYSRAGFGGGYPTVRSFSAPSSMGNYSAGRSYGSYMGGYSGVGGSRGVSGGSGGFGGRGFGGGGGGGHGGGGGGGGGRR